MSEKFRAIAVEPVWAEALEKMDIIDPTPIQCQVIPAAIAGKNIIGQSATGTGKTISYLVPLLQKIELSNSNVQAIVLAPTYELGMQIFRQAELLVQNAGQPITCASLIGGANIARQMEKLKKKPQLIIGSAGRIMELKKKGKLKLENVKTVVLDEVDKLLDDQNQAGVRQVIDSIKREECQYLLVSATISPRTLNRANFVSDSQLIRLQEKDISQMKIENVAFIAEFRDKLEVLRKLTNLLPIQRGLVFVNRNDNVVSSLEKLRFHGLKVAALYATAEKMERKRALEDFSRGKVQLLLASDVAARGIDIADIDFVVNLDLPEDEKVYLHRAGRTGRAGKSGCVISLADPKEVLKLNNFIKKIKATLQLKKLQQGKIITATLPKRQENGNRVRKEAKKPIKNYQQKDRKDK